MRAQVLTRLSNAPYVSGLQPGEAGHAYFWARSGNEPSISLWRTDGTIGGTSRFVGNFVGSAIGNPDPGRREIIEHNGIVVFVADDGVHGRELWRSDGTDAGTFLLKDFYDGDNGGFPPTPRYFTIFKNSIYFVAYESDHNWQLWKTDGTVTGTTRVSNVSGYIDPNFHRSLFATNATLFFGANSPSFEYELWKTDGTAEGTTLVKVIPRDVPDYVEFLGQLSERVLFRVASRLWSTDGSTVGTVPIEVGSTDSSFPGGDAVVYGGKLYYAAQDSSSNNEPWVSDGTTAGTHVLNDIVAGQQGSFPRGFAVLGNSFYFSAQTVANNENVSLFKSDGTAGGTVPIAQAGPSSNAGISTAGALLYFSSSDSFNLWRSDGTVSGTFRVVLNQHGTEDAGSFTPVGDRMLFIATDGINGYQVWSATPEVVGAPQITSILHLMDGSVTVQGTGASSTSYTLQRSLTMPLPAAFEPLTTVTTNSAGAWTYTDTAVSNQTRAFYRAVVP